LKNGKGLFHLDTLTQIAWLFNAFKGMEVIEVVTEIPLLNGMGFIAFELELFAHSNTTPIKTVQWTRSKMH
jgi:hypothetical protein